MSVSESNLNQTFNRFRATGTVDEMGMLEQQPNGDWKQVPLRIVKTTRDKYVDGQQTNEKIPCEQLRGTVTLKTNKGIQAFNFNFFSVNSDGTPNENTWKMAKKIAEWVPATNPPKEKQDMEPSYVTMQGRVGIYDNVGKDGKMYSNLQWTANAKCQHAKDDEPSGCSLVAIAYLNGYRKETIPNGEEQEETGRLIVDLYGADNRGQCFPITCYVEADMADVFEENFEVGQTLDCEFNRVIRHVGATKPKKRTFGGGKSDVTVSSGFDVEELILVGADEIEEPEELTTIDENGNEVEVKTKWINPTAMKKAIKARAAMLEQKLEERKSGNGSKKGGNSSLQAKKQAAKMGSKTQSFVADEMDDEEDPF